MFGGIAEEVVPRASWPEGSLALPRGQGGATVRDALSVFAPHATRNTQKRLSAKLTNGVTKIIAGTGASG
jgi:hypothetical protein